MAKDNKDKKEIITSAVIKLFSESSPETNKITDETIDRLLLDIDISSALNKIERETAGRVLSVIAENPENDEQAKEINQRFSNIKFNRIINHLITARYYGYSCFEIVYNEDFTINSLVPIPYKYITYKTSDKKWVLRIGTNETDLNRDKFLLCIHKWNPAQPTGKTIFESCQQAFLDKEMFSRQLRGLAEKYGDTIIVFPYDENLDEKEAAEIGKTVLNAKGKNAIGVPVNRNHSLKDSFEFIRLSDLDPEIYTKLYAVEKEKLIQNLLGSTLTLESSSKNGRGTQALGEIHEEGFEQVVQEVCNFCSDSLYQLIQLDSEYFGYDATLFTWKLEKVVTEEEQAEIDKKQQEFIGIKLDNINKLSTAGYELENKYLGEYLGIDYTKILKKTNSVINIKEFAEEEDKKLFNTIEGANTFNAYVLAKLDKFTEDISQQIIEQVMNIKEGDDFVLNLDYSMLEDDLIISRIKGFSNSRYTTFNEVIEEFDPFKMKFEEAIKSFLDKMPVLYDMIEEVTEDVRANFIWLKKSNDLEITTRLFDSMKKSLENGTTFKQWVKDCEEAINKAGLGKQGYYLENVYRTNMMTQYSIGNYKQQMEVVEEYPYWEYSAIEDNRTSNICRQLDGVVKRYDDSFWSAYYPPNHFHCRSTVISRNKEELKKYNLKISKDVFEVDIKGFKGNPAESYWNNIKMTAGEKGRQGTFKWE
jgi:SPP1 gp7 family putative phage head morphogenesis protein